MVGTGIAIFILVFFGLIVFRGAPYVPTKRQTLEEAFSELYVIGPDDLLVDIGSGDGVVLRAAARRGARTVGYELNPILVGISWLLSRNQQLVRTVLADFWFVRLPSATTVVYTFGESRDISKMATKVQTEATRLGRPLFFISYGFEVPGLTALRRTPSHFLYTFQPLQRDEA